jgi:hypothetical protein
MSGERKHRLVRLPASVDKALERAAAREMRSVNAQISMILRDAMTKSGDLKDPADDLNDEGDA